MILPLRRRHFAVFSVLAVVLPLAYVAALATRDPLPIAPAIPAELTEAIPMDLAERLAWIRTGPLWTELGIETAVLPDAGGPVEIALRPTRDPKLPKALVYWVPGVQARTALPDDAVLVGSLAGQWPVRLSAPAEARGTPGRLIVYSLGHQRVVAEGPAPSLAGTEEGEG